FIRPVICLFVRVELIILRIRFWKALPVEHRSLAARWAASRNWCSQDQRVGSIKTINLNHVRERCGKLSRKSVPGQLTANVAALLLRNNTIWKTALAAIWRCIINSFRAAFD